MKFKDCVSVIGVTKECIMGMAVVDGVISSLHGRELVITSVTDGRHRANSKHYEGNAFDIRTWTEEGVQMTTGAKNHLRYLLSVALGNDWDVVTESTHIHIEYDPQ